MSAVLTIDGRAFQVDIPQNGIKRSGSILDGPGAGRTRSGYMMRDLIGTYYNYTIQVNTGALDPALYDALYEVLTAPVECHTITVPYGQDTLTFAAYIANVEDGLVTIQGGKSLWGGLSFTFTAMEPQRIPK